jgi:hypothetical protein
MYVIIGGDGKEYGPVGLEQVRAWIAGGRADLNTQAKLVGTETWRRLGDFADFGGAAAGAAQAAGAAEIPMQGAGASAASPGGAAPTGVPLGTDAASIATAMIARSAPLDISGCYERSWRLLRGNFWPLVGVTTLVLAIQSLLGVNHVGLFAGGLLGGVFSGGQYFYVLKKIRGAPTSLGDAFAGFSRAFVPLVLAGVVMTIMISAGFILLILPGIYLAVAYGFTYLLVIDRGLGFWTAMEVSRKVITAQWWRLLGLALLAIPFLLLGLAALLVGVLVVVPLIFGAFAYAYQDLCLAPTPTAPLT